MILNYRVEFCRSCYWGQNQKCKSQDSYVQNANAPGMVNGEGECLRRLEVPWLA